MGKWSVDLLIGPLRQRLAFKNGHYVPVIWRAVESAVLGRSLDDVRQGPAVICV
jgi:hypothetical protein